MQFGEQLVIQNEGGAEEWSAAKDGRARNICNVVDSNCASTGTCSTNAVTRVGAAERHLVLDLRTGEHRPVVVRPPVLATALCAWDGVSLEQHCGGAVESIDFLAPDHVIIVQLTEATCEFRGGAGPFRTVSMRRGDVVILPAMMQHSVRTRDSGSFVSVRLKPNFVFCAAHELIDPDRVELTTRWGIEDALVRQLALSLKAEAKRGEACGRIYAESLASALAVHVVRHHSTAKPVLRNNSGGLPRYHLRRIVDYIAEHLAENISLAQLAGIAGLSPFHFARAFKRATGMAPHQFVVQQRVRRAKELLLQRDRTIADVALAVGFCDQSHLAAHFKRLCGITPKRFCRQSAAGRRPSQQAPLPAHDAVSL